MAGSWRSGTPCCPDWLRVYEATGEARAQLYPKANEALVPPFAHQLNACCAAIKAL
jgi:hypothetical protein